MTRERAKQLLPVIQAWANGEEIQLEVGPGRWVDFSGSSPAFDYSGPHEPLAFRIKPKPREWWYRPGDRSMHGTKESALNNVEINGNQIIHLREVIDEK